MKKSYPAIWALVSSTGEIQCTYATKQEAIDDARGTNFDASSVIKYKRDIDTKILLVAKKSEKKTTANG